MNDIEDGVNVLSMLTTKPSLIFEPLTVKIQRKVSAEVGKKLFSKIIHIPVNLLRHNL